METELQIEMGKRNIFLLPNWRHVRWHQVFLNMTPIEVIACLSEYYAPDKIKEAHVEANVFDEEHQYIRDGDNTPMPLVDDYRLCRVRLSHVKSLFPGYSLPKIVKEVVDVWSPEEYFRYVNVVVEHQGKLVRIERTCLDI